MTSRRRPALPIDVLLAALEADLVAATDADIHAALEDARPYRAAIDEVRDVLVSACDEAGDGDRPAGSAVSHREGLPRH